MVAAAAAAHLHPSLAVLLRSPAVLPLHHPVVTEEVVVEGEKEEVKA